MASVSSAVKVDGIDLQTMVHAVPPFARPQPDATPASDSGHQSDTRISAAGRLQGATSAVMDAAARLTKADTWSATKAVSSDDAVVQAVSNQAAVGDYSVTVDAVATAQTTSSATFSSLSTVIGLGTMNLEVGDWNASQTAFAMNPNWPKANVTFGPKDDSLERIRDKINAAGVGVVASVISDATGSRLVLRSTSTGQAHGFKANVEPAAKTDSATAQALASLGYDPAANGQAGNASGGSQPSGGTLVQPGQDAQLSIDGRDIRSAQNVVDDETSGLSLAVKATSQGKPVQIRVDADTEALQRDIHGFADAYNDMAAQLKQADPSSDAAKAPSGDRAAVQHARDIQSRVQQALAGDPATASRFRSAGIQLDADGRITVDHQKLGEALRQHPDEVRKLFTSDGTGNDTDGSKGTAASASASAGASSGDQQAQGLAQRLNEIEPARDQQDAGRQPAKSADAPADAPARSARAEDGIRAARDFAAAQYRQKLLQQYAVTGGWDASAASASKHAALGDVQANAA